MDSNITINSLASRYSRRQAAHDGAKSMAAQVHTFSGEFIVSGAGEYPNIIVEFPVSFTEVPSFFSGWRLPETPELLSNRSVPIGTTIVPGKFPWGVATAYDFVVEDNPPSPRLFHGCKIGVVVDGPIGTKMICNYSFTGKAIINDDTQYLQQQ